MDLLGADTDFVLGNLGLSEEGVRLEFLASVTDYCRLLNAFEEFGTGVKWTGEVVVD